MHQSKAEIFYDGLYAIDTQLSTETITFYPLDFGRNGHTLIVVNQTRYPPAEPNTESDEKMENRSHSDQGLKLMVKKCRSEFKRTENKDHHEDYRAAERKFVKFCLFNKTGQII